MNSYSVHARQDPRVRLQAPHEITGREFESAAREASEALRSGNVVTIDLRMLPPNDAVHLVNFCSGMASISRGWIFRVTADVIVVTPKS
ncbi:cell division protein SepF [Micromonospora sp. NPDC050686]|uniref:cell division protein SepF n=1 Tax=Micromonospora sp. NPDC050686 TaxID=3154631 RepID=UPI0033EC55DD